jgi:ABC-type transport system involved in multi-copper enzyme maturation permease subunit
VIGLRAAALVAWFDLRESLRSWKALALMVIYLMGSIGAAVIFVQILAEIESTMAATLSVAQTSRPGAMTASLMESEQVLNMLSGLIGDSGLAAQLVATPPVALFYGWMSMTFVPMLVTFTSAESISGELSSGACRYSLFRVDRLSWAVGKLLGQGMLMATGILAGAAGMWAVGFWGMNAFDGPATAAWLLRFSLRAWVYGYAFLGMTMGLSQLTRSVNGARALALIGLIIAAAGGGLLSIPELVARAPVAAETLRQVFPNAHKLDLWRPEADVRASAMVMLLALGTLAFSLGHQWMCRRDA